jgi:signal transduction histidine kinase/ActR/RegA family two-component response regulator
VGLPAVVTSCVLSDSTTARVPVTLSDSERARRGALLLRVAHVMGGLTLFAFVSSLFEPKNSKPMSVLFYSVVALGVWVVVRLIRRGRVVLAAWILCSFFWTLIAFAVLFCGGMQGENAATFIVCIMLIGSVVGGRAAIIVALVTSLSCAVMALLEHAHRLPPQLTPYSPIDAWVAVTVTLILTSVLLRASLESLQRANEQVEASAKERDRALAKSIEAQKMEVVGNLSGGIAHDFNNLLMVIAGSTAMLREDLSDAREDARRCLDDIDAATSRATLMTRQLLSFGGGRVDEHLALDLTEVVRSMTGMLPRLLGSKIVVQVRTPHTAVVVEASRAGLEQILLNLSVNARDAMPEGGELTLELAVVGDFAVLTARDSGHGMRRETLERVFEPFFTTKSLGTGLGLATVQARVQQFGGTIVAQSELGHGASFELRLPLLEGVVPRPPSVRPVPPEPAFRGRALLVEDDGLVRRTVGRILESLGFEVTSVANGFEALALLRDTAPFAVVVSDLSMPRLDGRSLLEQLRERFPALPVVLISGNPDAEPRGSTHQLPILQKPVEKDGLLRAIQIATASASGATAALLPPR